MKKRDKRPVCRCDAYKFPHRLDKRYCASDDYTADHVADDPRRWQASELNRLARWHNKGVM